MQKQEIFQIKDIQRLKTFAPSRLSLNTW
jgi:hypothetical protein